MLKDFYSEEGVTEAQVEGAFDQVSRAAVRRRELDADFTRLSSTVEKVLCA